ncbi:hybrid sensor histidine kinase/response regulator [Pseudomonas schmalbachii]|uniref:histidine kinase n=1 Tax=Pseudomonas schmalbachii TaxID=2816993 RepID=A0ABS3TMC3_9PSED|nr:hybrid sensor histidine kinase/response regulator [Pseudomonas schmalbachii]MBO3274812.1 hybrid sensor histidine kinase/response regulator [Pseudomonas schmalbachii]
MTPEQLKEASMLELFRLEAEDQAQVLAQGLLALERNPTQADQLEACMRAAHSLKGAARIVGLEAGVQVAHVMEECLVDAQHGRLLLGSEHIDALLAGTDILLHLADSMADKAAQAQSDAAALIERLHALAAMPPAPHSAASHPADAAPVAEAPLDAPLRPGNESLDAGDRVLRVTAERLNQLLDLSGKALVAPRRLKPLLDSLQRLKRLQAGASRELDSARDALQDGPLSPHAQLVDARRLLGECQQLLGEQIAELEEFCWRVSQGAQSLYDTALACRMRPFADVLNGQARMVRDLGRSLGKLVRLEVDGASTQVDRDVLEKLEAPLTHLLRNAVDHGIETPEQRVLAGKPEEGVIHLSARQHAGMLVMELRDDGAGVDLELLSEAVVRRQLASAETAARMSEDELLAFLFLPGFSLRERVTEVSGRGVGLDAVQHMVRKLRGGIRMAQVAGSGSHFRIEVPLTLTVVRSLVVQIGGEAYAFPLAHIERMRSLAADEVVQLEGRQQFWHDGRHIGLVSASQLLQRPEGKPAKDEIAVVIIRDRETVHGLAVERFIGERTLVVLPLDPRLGKVQDVSAGALLDDGSPVLILDVEDLLRSVEKLMAAGRLERIDPHGRAADVQRKRVLVVDDSLTVRELERKLLSSRGYDVVVAVDGMDGWNVLRSQHFDLVITDIDMPRMDGIELVTLIRRDTRLQSLPVMVVSYKDRELDRQRGLEAGADYYLAKASYRDEALLDAVVDLIGGARA